MIKVYIRHEKEIETCYGRKVSHLSEKLPNQSNRENIVLVNLF